MSNNILVIGNGFDLAHGRKTKYSDFLEWICNPNSEITDNNPSLLAEFRFPDYEKSSLMTYLISCYKNKSRINTWIDLELELKVFIHNLDSLINSLNERDYSTTVNIYNITDCSVNVSNTFLINQLVSIFELDSPGAKLINEYIDIWWKIDKQKIFETIQNELIKLSQMLEFYLVDVEPLLSGTISKRSDIVDINPSYVISFNYTDTIQEYYGVKSEDICYIHGKIKENNLVLGYDDSDGETSDLQFKKYYQRLIYNTNKIDFRRFRDIDVFGDAGYSDIYFFGHSLDVSDKDILFKILMLRNKIYIYYKDDEDKNRKIKNLISIIGKKGTERRLSENIIFYKPKNVIS